MVQAAESGSRSSPIDGPDWSALLEDLLVTVLLTLHIVDAVRSGAVCTSWHAAYAAFRRLRVPSPRQPPACSTPAMASLLASPRSTLRIPFPLAPPARRPLLGSGHGWLVTADEASDLHLLNPVTGAQVALPPITALHHVKTGTDEQGNPAYNVYEDLPYDHCFEIDTETTILDMAIK